jgi:hypothetical protein
MCNILTRNINYLNDKVKIIHIFENLVALIIQVKP